jgi:hypothetical protein
MGEGKCTFGTRMPIDIHMLNEIIYREVKHFKNYKIYRPNFGCEPTLLYLFSVIGSIDSYTYIHTYHSRFIPEGVAEVSQIFLRSTHVFLKFVSYEEHCRRDRW